MIREDREVLDRIHKGVLLGVAKAVKDRKMAGKPIAVWGNGKVEWIPSEKIVIKGTK